MQFKKILCHVDVASKEELFERIASEFAALGVVSNRDDFITALNEREETISTGLLDGIAIPHGKSATVISNDVLMLKLKNPIEYETLDGSLVEYVFALAISDKQNDHLATLSQLSMKLMDESCIEQLKEAQNEHEIAAIFA